MSYVYYASILQEIKFIHRRKGGSNKSRHHSEWCQTVQFEPDVISMSFIPITSLLSGINGSGFLTHAINLYTRCKCEFFSIGSSIAFYEVKGCFLMVYPMKYLLLWLLNVIDSTFFTAFWSWYMFSCT